VAADNSARDTMAMKIGRYGIVSNLKKCTSLIFGVEKGECFPALMGVESMKR